jgi:hypothetical protein
MLGAIILKKPRWVKGEKISEIKLLQKPKMTEANMLNKDTSFRELIRTQPV